MAFINTIVIPAVNEQVLKQIKERENAVTLIVLGNDQNAQKAAQIADGLTTDNVAMGLGRQSVWVQDRKFFKDQLYSYFRINPGSSGFSISDFDTAVVLSISRLWEIRCIIKNGDPIDYLTIDKAFNEAGK